MLEDLISAGADVGATRLPSGGNPVLILTITGPYNPDVVVIVERMLDAGADVNQANVNGVTAVAAAAAFSEQSVGLVGLLLERGADPNIIQRSGANLLFATMFGSACEDLIPLVLASPIQLISVIGSNSRPSSKQPFHLVPRFVTCFWSTGRLPTLSFV
jgi:hypothetical protein